MSIERHSSHDSEALAQRALETRRADTRLQGQKRETPSAEAVDRFNAALQKQGEPRQQSATREAAGQPGQSQMKAADQGKPTQHAQQAEREDQGALQKSTAGDTGERVSRKDDNSGQHSSSSSSDGSSADMASMWQSQMALRNEALAMPATPLPVNTQVFAELIQRHVRQMAASDSALRDSDGQVLLRMSDATLPGTDLLLSRTADGWRLQADSRSRSSYDAIREAAPELAKRFADSNLGHLEIDPQFHQ